MDDKVGDIVPLMCGKELTWKKSSVNDELSGTVIASGAGGLILLVLLILAFIRKRESDDDEDYIEDKHDEQDVPIAGPPATAFAGPPATTISSPSPMEEYQKQLDEYNRKMAEYQAWQDTRDHRWYVVHKAIERWPPWQR